MDIVLELETHKQRILSEASWVGSCSIGNEPYRGQFPLEDEPNEPRE